MNKGAGRYQITELPLVKVTSCQMTSDMEVIPQTDQTDSLKVNYFLNFGHQLQLNAQQNLKSNPKF